MMERLGDSHNRALIRRCLNDLNESLNQMKRDHEEHVSIYKFEVAILKLERLLHQIETNSLRDPSTSGQTIQAQDLGVRFVEPFQFAQATCSHSPSSAPSTLMVDLNGNVVVGNHLGGGDLLYRARPVPMMAGPSRTNGFSNPPPDIEIIELSSDDEIGDLPNAKRTSEGSRIASDVARRNDSRLVNAPPPPPPTSTESPQMFSNPPADIEIVELSSGDDLPKGEQTRQNVPPSSSSQPLAENQRPPSNSLPIVEREATVNVPSNSILALLYELKQFIEDTEKYVVTEEKIIDKNANPSNVDVPASPITSATEDYGQVEEQQLDDKMGSLEDPNQDSRMEDLSSIASTASNNGEPPSRDENLFCNSDQDSVSTWSSPSPAVDERQQEFNSFAGEEYAQVEEPQLEDAGEVALEQASTVGDGVSASVTPTRRELLRVSMLSAISPLPPAHVVGMLKRIRCFPSSASQNNVNNSSPTYHPSPRPSAEDPPFQHREPLVTDRNSTTTIVEVAKADQVPPVKRGRGRPRKSIKSSEASSTTTSTTARSGEARTEPELSSAQLNIKRKQERDKRRILRNLRKRFFF